MTFSFHLSGDHVAGEDHDDGDDLGDDHGAGDDHGDRDDNAISAPSKRCKQRGSGMLLGKQLTQLASKLRMKT